MSTVRVALFSINAMIFNHILKGIVHEASLTGMVTLSSRAVHQVLLTKGYKFSCIKSKLAFKRTSSAKRPTAATLTLQNGYYTSHGCWVL